MSPPPRAALLLALGALALSVAQVLALALTEETARPLLVSAALVPLLFVGAAVVAARAAGRDHARLARVALTDELTGLPNLRAFRADLARAVARRTRHGHPLAVAMVDLDGLKATNDAQGHQAGDARIRGLAAALAAEARDADGVYRLGGDEFAVLLADTSAWGALQFAQRLGARLLADGPDAPSASTGVTEATASDDPALVVRHADLALLEAKRAHRAVVAFTPELELVVPDGAPHARPTHLKTLATALARAVDARDTYTRSHCETVAELCVLIGVGLRLAPERLGRLRLAGLLHDVGKIGIEDAILNKPGALTDEEYARMQAHVTIGESVVAAADLPEEARWVRHHHERVDGGGYPEGLAGDVIPLESRIILVADAYEAMTSDRPYRGAQGDAAALAELRAHAGRQFDPDCVAALEAALGAPPATAAARAATAPR